MSASALLRPGLWLILVGGLCPVLAASPPAVTERKTEELAGLVIDYPADDEAFALGFARELSRLTATAPATAPATPGLSFDELKARRTEYLDAISRWLHLAKPTPQMAATYDQFLELEVRLSRSVRAPVTHFQVWRGSELKARLEAGELIPGIKLGESGATFWTPSTEQGLAGWNFPVLIRGSDTETGEVLAQKKAREAREMIGKFSESFSVPPQIQLVLHETVERAIIENYLRSADRRWFCEGVANYVAFKIIESRVGPADARRYYDLETQLAQYRDLRAGTRLDQWAALETQLAQKHDDRETRQGAANYAFATEVIFKAAAGKGPDFLPRLFAEMGQTPPAKAKIKTVYRAYEKTFGGDLRSFFPDRP